MEVTEDSTVPDVLVKFVTKQQQYSIPGTSIAVPSAIDRDGLNSVVVNFLQQGANRSFENEVEFDFLVAGELLVTTLYERLQEAGLSSEALHTIEFFEKQTPPTPQDSLQHDDWVSAVHCCQQWMLTGCYDNTVHLWDVQKLAKGQAETGNKLTIPAHKAPVKAVAWVRTEGDINSFISGSIDQTIVIWTWNSATNSIENAVECRGHTQSVECLSVDSNSMRFASGSWDNMLKIWSLSLDIIPIHDEPDAKKSKKEIKNKVVSPLMTLVGHTENVSGVVWTQERELATTSWDHSIRIWDADVAGVKSQMTGNCAFFCLDWSPLNRAILAGSADRHVRLYDPRATDGSNVQQKYTSHLKWISSVKWSRSKEHLFVSASHDHLVKMWDSRSPKTCLFDLSGHEDKVLSVDWSVNELIASGSADCSAKVFSC